MSLPGWTGAPLHALAGGAITAGAILLGIPGFVPLLVVGIGGWVREVIQHDLNLTLHQWLEAASWTAGSAFTWLVLEVVL